ncbi:unnamed protein product, partial [Symbiodinium microadriaticum]
MFHPWAGRIRYAMAKNVNFVIENPSSTLLWRYVTLVGNWAGLRQLRRTLHKERRCHLRRVRSFLKIQTVVRWKNAKGESKCVARILKTQEMQTVRPDDELLFRDAEPKGRGKSAAGAEAQQPKRKGAGKQSKGDPKGSGKSVEAEGKGEGSGKSTQTEEHPTPTPTGSGGKQSKGKGELKGSSKSAGPEEHPKGSGKQSGNTPKGSGGKQNKGKGELKGSGKSIGPADPQGGGKSATRALLQAVHREAADLCNTQHEHDEHQHWQYNIHDMTNRGEIHDADFRNPLVILPTCVLGELSNMQAKQPKLCQERLRSITEHQPMFAMFRNWQAQHYQNHTAPWGKAPAAQIMQHNKFLDGGTEPSTEVEADDGPGEEGEEELQEEPEEEEDDPEDDAEDGDEDEGHDDEGWDEAEEGEGADQGDGTGDDDDDEGIPTSGYPDDPDAPEPPAAAFTSKKPILRAPSSISVASLASKSSSISPVGVRDAEGKVRVLDEATRKRIQEMTHPNEMDAGERRRQREAMRRFEFLKAFMLDPDMTNMHIETVYSECASVSKVGTKTIAKKNVGKADGATKKKLGEILTSQAADFVKGTEVLTEEEIKKRDFDKTMQQILALAGKARTAAQSLKR